MINQMKSSLAIAFTLLIGSHASAGTILLDFEGLTNGQIVDNLFPEVTFSSPGSTVRVWDFGGDFAASGVNTIAPSSGFGDDMDLLFSQPVFNLSFFSGGDNDLGQQALIDVYVNGLLDSTVSLTGDGNATTIDFQDLTGFSNVTRININNVTDFAGLVYDDFQFDTDTVVPEPSSVAVYGIGICLVGVCPRRRKQTKA